MLTHCGGLPLGILVLGGMLMAKTTSQEWKKVCASIEGRGIGQQQDIEKVLALSYFDLPYHLKPSFSYLGTFPEDSEIEVENLCHLLIAEGLILSRDRVGDETMTEVAERYLHELAQRSMISLQERGYDERAYRTKCCHLHDLMRDLSLSKAKEQHLFEVFGNVAKNDDAELERSFASRRRVIACGNNESEEHDGGSIELKKRIKTRGLRSLIVHEIGKYTTRTWTKVLEVGRINFHLGKLKLLRVLVLEWIDLENTDLSNAGIGKLIYLRYLSLRGSKLLIISSSIGNLENLQTFDLRTNDKCFVPRNLLRKMGQLRHLYLPRDMSTIGGRLGLDCKNLETLENFDNTECNVKNLFKCTKLRKLYACVRDKQDLEYFIDCLTSDGNGSITLNRLQHLQLYVKYDFKSEQDDLGLLQKLVNIRCLDELNIIGIICKLPEYHRFSLLISKLELWNCKLEEDQMKTLERLPNLTYLNLDFNSFIGEKMTCSAGGFPKLKYLKFYNLKNLVKWIVEEGALPYLRSLKIRNCLGLKEIPNALRLAKCLEIWVSNEKVKDIENEKESDDDLY